MATNTSGNWPKEAWKRAKSFLMEFAKEVLCAFQLFLSFVFWSEDQTGSDLCLPELAKKFHDKCWFKMMPIRCEPSIIKVKLHRNDKVQLYWSYFSHFCKWTLQLKPVKIPVPLDQKGNIWYQPSMRFNLWKFGFRVTSLSFNLKLFISGLLTIISEINVSKNFNTIQITWVFFYIKFNVTEVLWKRKMLEDD